MNQNLKHKTWNGVMNWYEIRTDHATGSCMVDEFYKNS